MRSMPGWGKRRKTFVESLTEQGGLEMCFIYKLRCRKVREKEFAPTCKLPDKGRG